MRGFLAKFYNPAVEDIATRILYFFNTIDTYFLVAGGLSFILYGINNARPLTLLLLTAAVIVVFKTADFYPLFTLFSPLFLFFLLSGSALSLADAGGILLINLLVFIFIQFIFMGIPNSIVARDKTVGLRVLWNSLFTIAPTTVSLSMSVYFSTLYGLILAARPGFLDNKGLLFWLTISLAALISRVFKAKTFRSADFKPQIKESIAPRIVVLNIDGCRLDRFYAAGLPFLSSLQKKSSYFPLGMHTVYRALTNPAFASILSGAVPRVHGIRNNNLGQRIRVTALPDLVKTKLYGCMHIKHFSKPQWDTRIVSLPKHSIYKSDEIMLGWLKEDLRKDDGTRLFIADISEVDFLGHAYGSESGQYLSALKRTDQRIEEFFRWLKKNDLSGQTTVIVCSDHGIVGIDHSYLLFRAERYVPFMISGDRIKPDNPLNFSASIMDIAPTISYLLGIDYPPSSRGRVLVEALL